MFTAFVSTSWRTLPTELVVAEPLQGLPHLFRPDAVTEVSCSLQSFTWSIQAKPLEALLDTWHETPCEPELVFLQEVGGTFEESNEEYSVDEFHPKDGYEYTVFACHPTTRFRKVCMLARTDLAPNILQVHVLTQACLFNSGLVAVCSLQLAYTCRTHREMMLTVCGNKLFLSYMAT